MGILILLSSLGITRGNTYTLTVEYDNGYNTATDIKGGNISKNILFSI